MKGRFRNKGFVEKPKDRSGGVALAAGDGSLEESKYLPGAGFAAAEDGRSMEKIDLAGAAAVVEADIFVVIEEPKAWSEGVDGGGFVKKSKGLHSVGFVAGDGESMEKIDLAGAPVVIEAGIIAAIDELGRASVAPFPEETAFVERLAFGKAFRTASKSRLLKGEPKSGALVAFSDAALSSVVFFLSPASQIASRPWGYLYLPLVNFSYSSCNISFTSAGSATAEPEPRAGSTFFFTFGAEVTFEGSGFDSLEADEPMVCCKGW